MSTNLPQALPPYGPLYGAFYFGTILSTTFYGVACMQTFFYYVHYQADPRRMKIFVAVVWALNSIHEALNICGTYKYIMGGLVEPLAFRNGSPELILQVVLTVLVTVPTRGFFVYRIYAFTGKNIIAPLIWVTCAVTQLVTAILYVGKALYTTDGVQVVDFSTLSLRPFTLLATICLAVGAGVDIMIAIFMTFLFLRKRSDAGFASTTYILQRLSVFAVNTGIWPAVLSLSTIILLHIYSSNMLYAVPYVPLCSVYCNTLLANLNARGYLGVVSGTRNFDMDLFPSSGSPVFESGSRGEIAFVSSVPQGVWKTTEMVTFSDP